jgi:hypothetical protein
MKKNRKRLKFYICLLALAFFIFSSDGLARSGHSGSIRKIENKNGRQTNSPAKKKKKRKAKAKPKMNQSKMTSIPAGNWGAPGINLVVEDNGATIEYDCASGEIAQRLLIDEQGKFSISGIYTHRYPGAMRIKFLPKPQPARYEGVISGDKMTLKVTLTETGKTLDEVVLERNKTGRIYRCY